MIDKQIYTPEQCSDIFNFLDTLEVEYTPDLLSTLDDETQIRILAVSGAWLRCASSLHSNVNKPVRQAAAVSR